MALGLIGSEQLDDYWARNVRRRIFCAYPNGTAPLTGLISLMDNKDTPEPQFGWNEERWAAIKTLTSTTGQPVADTPFYLGGTTTTAGTPATFTAFQSVRVYVDDASNFQVDDVIKIFNVTMTSGTTDLIGRVTATNTDNADWIEFAVTTVPASTIINNTTANEGKYVYLIGSAYAEGSRSRTGRQVFPSEITNYTQIFKTPFELTRTALKAPLTYDKTGAYKDVSKTNGINHLSQIELTAFFGERAKTTAADPDTGAIVRRGFTGGIRWFLDQWEKGSISAGGAFDYGQIDVSAQTDWVTYTNKRVIKLGGATINRAQFDELNTRVFERTNSTDWSKLCLCGPGYMAKVAAMFEKQLVRTSLRDEGFKGFNFKLQMHSSNSGDIYYKTHPLFNDPIMRNSAFYIDLGYMGYRPLTDSDTDIQPMIQLPDADKRKDQWLTEAGFDIPFPEAFMYVENLGGITGI